MLNYYDLLVGRISNTWIWDCPRLRQLDLYNQHLTAHHMEIGSATGWYLNNVRQRYPNPSYTLVDLNPQSLDYAGTVLARFNPTLLEADIFEPIPVRTKFSSASLNFVLHCLPGDPEDKSVVIGNIAAVLADDGVLFGSTIVGKPARQHPQARLLQAIYNKIGVFSNRDDSAASIRAILLEHFQDVSLDEHWSGLLFVARHPKKKPLEAKPKLTTV